MANRYDEELMRWARAGGHGAMPLPAPRQPGSLAEQRRPRRDYLTERIMRADPSALMDRSAPLPEGIPIEHLLNHFMSAWMVEYFDRTEPGWDERIQRGRY
jgi:hypothetical protein